MHQSFSPQLRLPYAAAGDTIIKILPCDLRMERNMIMELLERCAMDPAYQWDLSSLYKDAAAWEADLERVDADIDAAAGYEGKLHTADQIAGYYAAYTALSRRMDNLMTYAMLRQCEDTRAPEANGLWARGMAKAVDADLRCAFAEPEILSLPAAELEAIRDCGVMAPYRFLLQQLIDRKPHVLSAESEQLLAGFGEVMSAPKTIAESLMDADLTFEAVKDSEGREHTVNQSDFILLQQSPDRMLRENSFGSFYKGYISHINTFAASYSGAVKSAAAEARARHYGSSRAMAMDGEHIPESVYDGLVDAVRRHLPAMHRYAALRKRLLGLDELHYYDVYVPLTQGFAGAGSRSWTYEEGKEMTLKALAPLGTEYTDVVRSAFESGWIDVYPNAGKRSGAFSSGTYDSTPFILMNYTGDYESVTTIAHEMGHSMHSYLSHRAQPYQYGYYTLFVAEVASTVNENLLVESQLSQTDDPADRLFLLNQYLEGFKGTVFRQTMFAEFERDAHRMAEAGEALTPQALNALYKRLVADYFGPELVIDDEVAYEWARIPHFYRPFYVYKYATSYCACVALSEAILHEGERAVKPYLEFLSMGGSAYPLDELRHAGIDMTTPAPIDAALEKFERILDEAEACAAALS